MFKVRVLSFAVACLLVAMASFSSSAKDARSPVQVVEAFHASLLEVMQNAEALGVEGRFDKLSEPMDQTFDLGTMIRVATTRRFWNDADGDQKKRLFAGFRRLSIATYAAQFDGYSGQRFETVGQRPGPQNTVLVATRIVDPDGSGVGLTYVVKQNDAGAWKIADVLLDDSISQLAVRRSEYRNILKRSGISGLIAELEGKSAKLLSGN